MPAIFPGGGSGGGNVSYALVREEQTSGTGGGTPTAITWTTRVLNTVAFDPSSIVASLTSNAFTLNSGTYIIQALAPMFAVGAARIRLFNQTGSSVVVYGLTDNFTTSNGMGNAAVNAVITLAGATALRIEYWAGSATASGLGVASSIAATVEVYTQVEIWKIG